jgi:hypothetical protein
MSSTQRILKNVSEMSEAQYTRIVTDYARKQYPTLTKERAFCKVFEDPSAEGVAIRRAWRISKGDEHVNPLGGGEVEDDEADEAGDPLDKLERLAAEERRRNPKLSKAQSFARVYVDPANVALAKAERRQSMRKIGVAV